MKKYFLCIVIAFGCASQKYNYDIVRKAPKQKLVPPGTVWLRDNLFIDETEVTNFNYCEFLNYLQKTDTAKRTLMLPDSMCWTRADVGFNQSNPLIKLYLKSFLYRNYPVVGISYEQAIEFCNWRSDMVNVYYYIRENKLNHSSDNFLNYIKSAPHRVKYRLPTKEEWEYASAAGLKYCDYPLGYEKLTDKEYRPVANTLEFYTAFKKNFSSCSDTIPVTEPTNPVYSGKPNRYGLYQMLGNVSELIADRLVKGLNYSKPMYSIERVEWPEALRTQTYNYKLTDEYTRPEPWIGFRCVCEVLEK